MLWLVTGKLGHDPFQDLRAICEDLYGSPGRYHKDVVGKKV
jgi:hypothetical protein